MYKVQGVRSAVDDGGASITGNPQTWRNWRANEPRRSQHAYESIAFAWSTTDFRRRHATARPGPALREERSGGRGLL